MHHTHRFVAELLDPAWHVRVASQLRGDVGRHGRVEERPDQKIGHLFLLLLGVEFFWKNKSEKNIIIRILLCAVVRSSVFYFRPARPNPPSPTTLSRTISH